MKQLTCLFVVCIGVFAMVVPVHAKDQPGAEQQMRVKPSVKPMSKKGAVTIPGPFRVQSVQFKEITLNNKKHLSAAIIFNKFIDASSVQPNVNVRLLKKNQNYQWVDASTQGNIVKVRPKFITWVSGAPLETAVYIIHLRGTLKSQDGVFLDTNNDGQGEGGNLPPYESQMYNAVVNTLIPIDPDKVKEIEGLGK